MWMHLAWFFWSWWRFWHPLWWLDFRFDIVPVHPYLISCNNVFQKVIIIISSVQKLLTHVNSILFLIICQQAWQKFSCNAMHAQIFGTNFMAHRFWDTQFFSYLSIFQTTIWTDDFTNFCNIIVSFRRWWPSRTRIIINRNSALFETFPPLVRLSPAHGFFPECYFQHFKCLSNRFSNFHTEFHTNSLLMKSTHFLVSRELPDTPNMWSHKEWLSKVGQCGFHDSVRQTHY